MKRKYSLLLFFVCVTLVLSATNWLSTQGDAQEQRTLFDVEGWSFSDDDAQIIKHGDLRSASIVITKLWRLLGREGKDAVRPAVPALIYRFNELETEPLLKGPPGELQAESTLGILELLGRIGDERSKAIQLEGMKYGRGVAWGLMELGRSVVPDIIDSLGSTRRRIRRGAMLTLRKIATLDPNFLTKEDKDNIRERLHSLLGDSKVTYRTPNIVALEVFGDASTIPILQKIAAQDPYVQPNSGRYENRIYAKKAIEKIRAAQQSKNESQSPVNSE